MYCRPILFTKSCGKQLNKNNKWSRWSTHRKIAHPVLVLLRGDESGVWPLFSGGVSEGVARGGLREEGCDSTESLLPVEPSSAAGVGLLPSGETAWKMTIYSKCAHLLKARNALEEIYFSIRTDCKMTGHHPL